MKPIGIPTDQDELHRLIETYFYGCVPNYQIPLPEGKKKYWPYYYSNRWKPGDAEPVPCEIISEHVEGERTWASRATDGEWAYFAALDVDTTDEGLLNDLEAALDQTYGPIYNWERSGSGVHVWWSWEGKIPLPLGIAFIELLEVPVEVKEVIDLRCPTHNNCIRLPFFSLYDPVPHFRSNETKVICQEEMQQVVERHGIEIDDDMAECNRLYGAKPATPIKYPHAADQLAVINDLYRIYRDKESRRDGEANEAGLSSSEDECTCPREYGAEKKRDDLILRDTYRISLRELVDIALSQAPEDGKVYDKLIKKNVLAMTIASYGGRRG